MDKKGDTLQPCGITSVLLSNALDMRPHPWEGKQQLTILHNELLHDTQRLLMSSLHSSYQQEDNSFCITTHSLGNLYKETLQSTFDVILLTFVINCSYLIFVYLS